MKRVPTTLPIVLLAFLFAPAASAQDAGQVVAPPGNSAVDEYLEVVPGAGGDQPAENRDGAAGRSSSADQVLGAQTARELDRLGADGRAAAAVAAAGVPTPARTRAGAKEKREGNAAGASEDLSVEAEADGGGGAIAGALAGSGGGIGLGLPLVLFGALAAALGVVAIRRSARGK